MRSIFFGAFIVLLFYGCKKETSYVDIKHYPSGEKMIVQEYYMENTDSIFLFEKILYKDGKVWMEGSLEDRERSGLWKAYYENGDTWSESEYVKGKRHGIVTSYYKNKQVRYTGFFYDDKSDGKWVWYDSLGSVEKNIDFTFQKDK